MTRMADDRFYFRQLLSGRDFAQTDGLAHQMVNFSYLIGDRISGECLVVDPAYDTASLAAAAEADGMRLAGALVTHFHADHCGGDIMGYRIEGIASLLEHHPIPIHVQSAESDFVTKTTGVGSSELVSHEPGDVVTVGEIPIELVHTPGHTPGSQCFLLDGMLVAGDTLFLEGCGRTDFPGGSVDDMYRSLQQLAQLPGDPTVFPGHWYSMEPNASLSNVRRTNYVYRASNLDQWRMLMGG